MLLVNHYGTGSVERAKCTKLTRREETETAAEYYDFFDLGRSSSRSGGGGGWFALGFAPTLDVVVNRMFAVASNNYTSSL